MARIKGYQVSDETKRKARETNLIYAARVKQALEIFPYVEKMLVEIEQLRTRNQELESENSRLGGIDRIANELAEENVRLERQSRNCTCFR